MENKGVDRLVKQLITGFETLQDEYQKLHSQHQALERKLATARDQVGGDMP
jgi:cell division septum initiation protein DivIVA